MQDQAPNSSNPDNQSSAPPQATSDNPDSSHPDNQPDTAPQTSTTVTETAPSTPPTAESPAPDTTATSSSPIPADNTEDDTRAAIAGKIGGDGSNGNAFDIVPREAGGFDVAWGDYYLAVSEAPNGGKLATWQPIENHGPKGTFDSVESATAAINGAIEHKCLPPNKIQVQPPIKREPDNLIWKQRKEGDDAKPGTTTETLEEAYNRITVGYFKPEEASVTIPQGPDLGTIYAMPNGLTCFTGSATEPAFISVGVPLDHLRNDIFNNSAAHGFWGEAEVLPDGQMRFNVSKAVIFNKMLLIHSEISEFVEAMRLPEPEMDKHIPGFRNFEIEAADIIIRVLDLSVPMGIRIVEAISAKHTYNKTRPHMHGKAC